jgi:thymidylate synthase (FAD)
MIDVEYLRHSGDDLAVVNAARVSFDAESEWENSDRTVDYDGIGDELSERDTKLINYLAKHKHKSPFNHAFVSFRVTAPIFVARQLVKHEYLPWNEVSRRYVEGELEFYWPADNDWRCQPENVKQGSGEALDEAEILGIQKRYRRVIDHAQDAYNYAISVGLSREQARMFLPQSLMTTWIWSGSVYAFAKMCQLRLDNHAQKESQYVAKPISDTLHALFPVSMAALEKHGAN